MGSAVWRNNKRNPRTPDGLRVYAIGDVHGRADLLAQLLAAIDADIAAHPAFQAIEVFLGDYIDRGPKSQEVLDMLVSRRERRQMVCLKGNHEAYVLTSSVILRCWPTGEISEALRPWYLMECSPPSIRTNANNGSSRPLLIALYPSHRRFLSSLTGSFECGDYLFVHAGIRPGVPLPQQREEDLLWIREDFLLHEKSFGKIVIHGHTPVEEPDIRPNRINIDTGAYATGKLSCLVLQDEDMAFI